MASLPRVRRHRSSTTKSNALPIDGQTSLLESLIRRLGSKTSTATDNSLDDLDQIARILADAPELEQTQDHFRRFHGFQALLALLRSSISSVTQENVNGALLQPIVQVHIRVILILLHALRNHEGNHRYFAKRVEDGGWTALESLSLALQTLVTSSLPQAAALSILCTTWSAVLALAMGDNDLVDIFRPPYDSVSKGQASDGASNEVLKVSSTATEDSDRQASLQDKAQAPTPLLQLLGRNGQIMTGEAMHILCSLYQSIPRTDAKDNEWHFLALTTLFSVAAIADSSFRNKIALHASNVGSVLLKCLLSGQIPAAETPALTSICQVLLSDGIDSLEDAALLFQHASTNSSALQLLHKAVTAPKCPPCIQFDLSQTGHSSVELPCMPRAFPPVTGYSLTAWLRVDDFDPQSHTTLFGAFDSSQTCFVLVYLEKDSHQLILQTSVTSSRPSIRFRGAKFDQGSWYHIALVHQPNKSNVAGQCALYVNGRLVETKTCTYPQNPPLVQAGFNASPFPPEPGRRKPVQTFFGTPQDLAYKPLKGHVISRWSLANAHLYDTCLSGDLIAVRHGLGPSYGGNYQDHVGQLLTYRASAELNLYNEEIHHDKAEHSAIVAAIQQPGSNVMPEGGILVSISGASVTNVDGCIGQSIAILPALSDKVSQQFRALTRNGNPVAFNSAKPAISDALVRSYGAAVLTGQPTASIPQTIDDASWRIGGSLAINMRLIESANTAKALLSAVDILFHCIQDNWRTSEVMEKENGYGIMALLLREKLAMPGTTVVSAYPGKNSVLKEGLQDRRTLALDLLKLVLEFVGYSHANKENALLINPMAYRVFLLDFDTWRVSSSECQKLYYDQFANFLDGNRNHSFNSKRFSKMRLVRRLLDSLKVDSIYAPNLPSVLSALKTIFVSSASQDHHRDLASFIAFALQEARAATSVSSIARTLKHKASVVGRHPQPFRTPSPRISSQPDDDGFQARLSIEELGVRVLETYAQILCSIDTATHLRRFFRKVPGRWLLHVVAETDPRAVAAATKIIARCLVVIGPDFKTRFSDKNSGFSTIKARLKSHWNVSSVWLSCFAILFGRDVAEMETPEDLKLYHLLQIFSQTTLTVRNPEIFATIANMLEAGLQNAVGNKTKTSSSMTERNDLPLTIIRFLAETHSQSSSFRDFAGSSQYVQDLLFVLYPVISSTDRLSASAELASNGTLNFKGKDVVLRPHSNSLGERPAILRSGSSITLPEQNRAKRIQAPRRPSSFVIINAQGDDAEQHLSAHFSAVMSPSKGTQVNMRIGNDMAEALLEVIVAVLIDQVCVRKDFSGFGLFLKVPPGYQEYQAYFESYVLLHTMYQLWNHLQLHQELLLIPRTLTNLARYSLHMAEAVFEGWFIDGAQPLVDFTGKVLDYLQQPDVYSVKDVRLCSQAITTMRAVFLRITLLRLSELDESQQDADSLKFLQQLTYWQTILFSPENQELPFIRLICYVLYIKLLSQSKSVRLLSASLFRMLLVQKPSEAATILIHNAESDQRHLSTGLMKLATHDDEELLQWIDDRRALLDKFFLQTLARFWQDFVESENQKTEESAKNRLGRRRDKLRQWQMDEAELDNVLHRFDVSTRHWRVNIHAQERLKLQRSSQDLQENISHLQTIMSRLDVLLRQPCGLFADMSQPKWQLDQTEARNRMRMRLTRDTKPAQEAYQPKRKASQRIDLSKMAISTTMIGAMRDDIASPVGTPTDPFERSAQRHASGGSRNGTPDPDNAASTASLLEGEFEMVEDPREDDEGFEDKNRKIMRSVQRGDQIQYICNVSRIVGLEACEGLLIVGKLCLYLQDNMFQRSDGEIVSIAHAPLEERDQYVQMISGKEVKSQKSQQRLGGESARHWTWTEVLSISKRRFLFRDVAIEVFFSDGRSYLLTFTLPAVRNEVYSNMVNKAPHVHGSLSSLSAEDAWRLDSLRNPEETPQSFGSKFANVFNSASSNTATRRWLRGETSNFNYLMLVNTMAGRTFNDLTQYPVFPWVLADYTSDELDLTDPRSFRDLSKPMGCQHPARESEFRERYQSFAEMGDENPFHYGTHYSSAMIVTSYLIRLQPFVQSYLLLQGGAFDHADRLFDSIEKAWQSSSRTNMTDVRELTPEFFYLPEFLTNINDYDFGRKEGSGQAINHVHLPPWAKGDPQLFIAKNREALESSYVSEHLHEWIDLVFGYKQRGEAALDATNVFHPLSYHGAKDLDAIDDPVERLATIGIIHNFGQTPHQVFQRVHPRREAERHKVARLDTCADTLTKQPSPLFDTHERVSSLTYSATQERLLPSPPCKLNLPPSGKHYVQWLFSDNSLRFFSADTKKLLGLYEQLHIGPISTALIASSTVLITAGADCTLGLWSLTQTTDAIKLHPQTYLFGHRTPVTVLAASSAFSTLVSASTDGAVLLWDLVRADCIRAIHAPNTTSPPRTVDAAAINNVTGHVALCMGADIFLYTLNGHLLLHQRVCDSDDEHISSLAFYEGVGNEWLESELLFTGHKRGVVKVWSLVTLSDGAWHLQLVKHLVHGDGMAERFGTGAGVVMPAVTAILPTDKAVYTGDEGGKVWQWDCMQKPGRR